MRYERGVTKLGGKYVYNGENGKRAFFSGTWTFMDNEGNIMTSVQVDSEPYPQSGNDFLYTPAVGTNFKEYFNVIFCHILSSFLYCLEVPIGGCQSNKFPF